MKQADEDIEQIERQFILPARLSPIKRNSVEEVKEVHVSTVTATQGASTADIPTSTPLSAETQTRNRDLEPKGREYVCNLKTPKEKNAKEISTLLLIQLYSSDLSVKTSEIL